MVVINFFAGPGAGKSTCVAELFAYMKRVGHKVELVTEYAKELVYERTLKTITQEKIFAEQHWRVERLRRQVDYVITDSPILLSAVYKNDNEHWVNYVGDVFDSYDNFNVWVERPDYYTQHGRIQSKKEAYQLDQHISAVMPEADWTVTKKEFDSGLLLQALSLTMRRRHRREEVD